MMMITSHKLKQGFYRETHRERRRSGLSKQAGNLCGGCGIPT